MTFTFHLAAAGESADSRIPRTHGSLDDCFDTDGRPLLAKLVNALSVGQINIGSDDSPNCLVMGATVLEEFHKQTAKIEGVTSKPMPNVAPPLASLHGAEKKLYKGAVAFVRVRVNDRANGNVRLSVVWENPREVVGSAPEFAHDVAVYLVQIADAVAAEYRANGSTCNLVVEDHPKCVGLVAEARADKARRDLRRRRETCKHRVRGWCVASADGEPPDFKCGCYECGKCKEI